MHGHAAGQRVQALGELEQRTVPAGFGGEPTQLGQLGKIIPVPRYVGFAQRMPIAKRCSTRFGVSEAAREHCPEPAGCCCGENPLVAR